MQEEVFDYIIVGAGSAGCVLAERLSADGRSTVLLIEEGPADSSWLLRMPKGFGQVLGRARYSSKYAATRAPGQSDETWVRGRTLGGSSSVNGMTWIRCQREDFDEIGARNPGWSWADMAPYFSALDGDGNGKGIIEVHSHAGKSRVADAFIAAGGAMGWPVRDSFNGEQQEGVGYLHTNIDARGRRSSAATGFLKPARGRSNLAIVTGISIDRVIFKDGRATAVTGLSGSVPVTYRARGEIVLSAGAIGSPLILQRSGIGSPQLLASHGIPVTAALPQVGENMSEHILLSVNYRLASWADSENREYGGWRLVANVARHIAGLGGRMSEAPYHAAAFARSHSGANRPDLQIMFAPFSRNGQAFDSFPGISIFGYQLRPESRGTIAITSSDPAAPPQIQPNYLSQPADQAAAVAIVRTIRGIAGQQALIDKGAMEIAPTAGMETDRQILDTFREHGRTACHACGTCTMGSGADAVVDARTRVIGVGGLRVVDCSIYPVMLSGNLNAPTMAVAMRAADLILQDRR